MEDTRIQWHPGFVAAMNMEFKNDREKLVFKDEYNLNKKPLEVDLLIIKKEQDIEIHNEIGKIFRRHNIMEYKSPGDSLDIDTFYKVTGYACLYKSYGETVDGIKANDVTISLVREAKPKKLFKYFEDNNVGITMPYKGIYYVHGMTLFPLQIIVTGELESEAHVWIRALTDRMEETDMKRLIAESGNVSNEYERKMVESIFEVTLNANIGLIQKMRGDAGMGEVMLKIMRPVILELEKDAEARGIERGIERGMERGLERGMERGLERGKIIGAVEVLSSFNSNDEIKKIIMEKFNLSEQEAEKYL